MITFGREAPREPLYFAGLLLFLALLGVVTSITDIALPVMEGKPVFSNLENAVARWGLPYLFFHVFFHNLGLACIVPGVGLFAAHLEPNPRLRRLIGPVLAFAVATSLGVAATWVLRSGAYTTDVVLLIFGLEVIGVGLLTWRGLVALRGYVPTPEAGWSFYAPTYRLAPFVVVSSIFLGMAAYIEVAYLAIVLG